MTNLLTQADVKSLARKVGFPTTPIATGEAAPDAIIAAIAICEGQTPASRLKTEQTRVDYSDFDAEGDKDLVTDYWWWSYSGLQIRSVRAQKGTGQSRDQLRLPDPTFALTTALGLFKAKRGTKKRDGSLNVGFEDWSTFNNNMHKAYLQTIYVPPIDVVIVKGGDTLSRIATREKQGTWQDWQRVNLLHDPNLIFIGQRLFRPWIEHKVAAGESLSGIAVEFGEGVTWQRIAEFNADTLPNPNLLKVGQIIRIPNRNL